MGFPSNFAYCDELLAQSQQLAWFSDKPLAVS